MAHNIKYVKGNSVPFPSHLLLSGCPCPSPQFYFANSEAVKGKKTIKQKQNPRWLDLLWMNGIYSKVIICPLQSLPMFSETSNSNTKLLTNHSTRNFDFELANVQRKWFSHFSRTWLIINFLWSHLSWKKFWSFFFLLLHKIEGKKKDVFSTALRFLYLRPEQSTQIKTLTKWP